MRLSQRLFRFLLCAYPKHVRTKRGHDMWLTFESHLYDARSIGWFTVLALWRREIVALWRGGRRARISEREHARAHRRRNPMDPELPDELLPDDWPGGHARGVARELYECLLPGALARGDELWADLGLDPHPKSKDYPNNA